MSKWVGKIIKSIVFTGVTLSVACTLGKVKVQAAEEVQFSASSGAYEAAFSLTLTAGAEDTIYYTLDGSNPADSENNKRKRYTSPIQITDRKNDANVVSAIDPVLFDSTKVGWDNANKRFYSTITAPANNEVDKATVIRAVSQDSAGVYSAIQTNTYFVGKMTEHIRGIEQSCKASGMDLAIMSITVQQEDFFDSKKGIYVHGDIFDKALEEYLKTGQINDWNAVDVARGLNANYKQKGRDWERQAHIDYFESNGATTRCKLQQDCGIRIQGNYSRSDLQKGMRLFARADYGEKNFKYAFFGDTAKDDAGNTIKKFKKLTLRNGGNCAFTTKYSDAYWQSLIRDLDCETQISRVCVVYLNGEYWGLYILQEEYDDSYFEQTHGVNKDDVVLYKGDAESLALGYKLDEGELPEGITDESYYFNDLLEFFRTHTDLKNQKDYDEFSKLVDVESVRDYFAVNIWINNKWDWPGKNWSVWRVTQTDETNPYADGRWRFCFYDLDFGGVSGANEAGTNTIKEDNYKENGLLDMNTGNPIVLMYAYLMTNAGFRKDFADKLQELTDKNFKAATAVAACEVYRDTYKPLYDQFFTRFGNVGNANDAVYGGYASFACIIDFIKNRASAIPTMLSWVDEHFSKEGETPVTPEQPTTPENPTAPEDPTTPVLPEQGGQTPVVPVGTTTDTGIATPPDTPGGNEGEGEGEGEEETVPLKIKKLKVTAKKGKKVIKISTVKKAKITVTLKRKIIKKGKNTVKKLTVPVKKNKNGKYKVSLSQKLKKGDTITVTVKKTGYDRAKKKVRIS